MFILNKYIKYIDGGDCAFDRKLPSIIYYCGDELIETDNIYDLNDYLIQFIKIDKNLPISNIFEIAINNCNNNNILMCFDLNDLKNNRKFIELKKEMDIITKNKDELYILIIDIYVKNNKKITDVNDLIDKIVQIIDETQLNIKKNINFNIKDENKRLEAFKNTQETYNKKGMELLDKLIEENNKNFENENDKETLRDLIINIHDIYNKINKKKIRNRKI